MVRTCLPKWPANLNSHFDKSYRTAILEGKEVDAFWCERAEGPLGTSWAHKKLMQLNHYWFLKWALPGFQLLPYTSVIQTLEGSRQRLCFENRELYKKKNPQKLPNGLYPGHRPYQKPLCLKKGEGSNQFSGKQKTDDCLPSISMGSCNANWWDLS